MASIYASQVETTGRYWYRPWYGLLVFIFFLWTIHWLFHEEPADIQVICDQAEGSRYSAAVVNDGLIWTADLKAALKCAAKHNRCILLAFHAVSDTNAFFNEHTVFRSWRVKKAMKRYVLVQLQIDFAPDRYYKQKPVRKDQEKDGEANLKFLEERFDTEQEPLYAVLQPTNNQDFRIVGVYEEARVYDPARFINFSDRNGFWGGSRVSLRINGLRQAMPQTE